MVTRLHEITDCVAMTEDKKRCFEGYLTFEGFLSLAGCDDYVSKPIRYILTV